MVDGSAKTPRYVLRDGSHPTCPSILQASPDSQTIVIFGFSDQPEYDAFLRASSLALTPYPLVKGFLKNQIAVDIDSLKLVVLDATSPSQSVLHAATMQAVLESFRLDSEAVTISHLLIFEETSRAYRVQEYFPCATERLGSCP